MKIIPLFAFACAAPLAALASPPADALLLKADRITANHDRLTLIGNATVVVRDTDTRLTAAEIIYDKSSELLLFSGPVKITTRGATIEAKDAKLSTRDKRVFTLSAGEVSLNVTAAPEPSRDSKLVPAFSEPMPKLDTKLPSGSR